MEIAQIKEILNRIGLNEYEAKAYTTLLMLGPSKAREISKESQIPQSKIYEVLETLTLKQLVETLEGRPKEFRAIEPEIALINLLNEKEREINELKKEIKLVSKILKPVKEKQNLVYGVWTSKGKKWNEFFDRMAEMIDRSKKYCYGITREFTRTSRMVEAVKNCLKRGVKFRVLGLDYPQGEKLGVARWYLSVGAEVKYLKMRIHPRILLVDGEEVLIRLDGEPVKKEGFLFYSLYSKDPSLVRVMDEYVKSLWKRAKPLKLTKRI